jgi:hypothetical protein
MTNTIKNKRKRRMAPEPRTEIQVGQETAVASPNVTPEEANAAEPKEPSKTAKVLSLLKRSEGTTLAELVEVTGWLPHTMRAALTGLRKKGHNIERAKVEGGSRYAIVGTAAQ